MSEKQERVLLHLTPELLEFLQTMHAKEHQRRRELTVIAEAAYAGMSEDQKNVIDENLEEAPRITLFQARAL